MNSLGERQDKLSGRKCFFSASLHFPRHLANCTLHRRHFLAVYEIAISTLAWWTWGWELADVCWLGALPGNHSQCRFLLPCRTWGHPQPALLFLWSLFKELKNLQERKYICENKFIWLPFLLINLLICSVLWRSAAAVLCSKYLPFCLGLVYVAVLQLVGCAWGVVWAPQWFTV